MPAFQIKDGAGATQYVQANGAGTIGDPLIPVHAITSSNSPTIVPVTWTGLQSAAFALPFPVNCAWIDPPGANIYLYFQVSGDGGASWLDTGLSLTAYTATRYIWTFDDLQKFAGFTGQSNVFRMRNNVSTTVTVRFYSRTMI